MLDLNFIVFFPLYLSEFILIFKYKLMDKEFATSWSMTVFIHMVFLIQLTNLYIQSC